MTNVTTPSAPAKMLPQQKRCLSISITGTTEAQLKGWADFMRRTVPGVQITPGSAVTEMARVLTAAGWMPGDMVRLPKSRK